MNLKNLSQISWEMIFFGREITFIFLLQRGFFFNYITSSGFPFKSVIIPYIKCLFVWGKFNFVYNKEWNKICIIYKIANTECLKQGCCTTTWTWDFSQVSYYLIISKVQLPVFTTWQRDSGLYKAASCQAFHSVFIYLAGLYIYSDIHVMF